MKIENPTSPLASKSDTPERVSDRPWRDVLLDLRKGALRPGQLASRMNARDPDAAPGLVLAWLLRRRFIERIDGAYRRTAVGVAALRATRTYRRKA